MTLYSTHHKIQNRSQFIFEMLTRSNDDTYNTLHIYQWFGKEWFGQGTVVFHLIRIETWG